MSRLQANQERAAKEARLADRINIMRRMWLADGRPEHQFWAAMMEVYAGTWPAALVNEPVDA